MYANLDNGSYRRVDAYYSPLSPKRTAPDYNNISHYDSPEKSPKKEKKWSIGSLFRRKKKDEIESSSDDETHSSKKNFLSRKKRKGDQKKKKQPKYVGTFDHVVLSQNQHLYSNGCSESNDGGKKKLSRQQIEDHLSNKQAVKSLEDIMNNSVISFGSASTDSMTKRNNGKKELAKIRAEARRCTVQNDSSSDENSVSSSRFRSDESVGVTKKEGTSASRRSRSARTERYLKRFSKDFEKSKDCLRLSKSDVENFAGYKLSDGSNISANSSPLMPLNGRTDTNSSLSNHSGLLTIPPSHGNHSRIRVNGSSSAHTKRSGVIEPNVIRNGCSDASYYLYNQRSLSCDADIHKQPRSESFNNEDIVHVQFPIGRARNRNQRNLSLNSVHPVAFSHPKQPPPPPPPRDPRRLATTNHNDSTRPNTYYLDENRHKLSRQRYNLNGDNVEPHTRKAKEFKYFNPSFASTSEDYLLRNGSPNFQQIQRPSSVTPEAATHKHHKFKPPENFNYLTDKNPRSRKPIFIENSDNPRNKTDTQKVLDFWRSKDKERIDSYQQSPKLKKPGSPQMFTSKTHVQTQIFLQSVVQSNSPQPEPTYSNDNKLDSLEDQPESTIKSCAAEVVCDTSPNSAIKNNVRTQIFENEEELKRKSANLEEALDELEAIYNSLRLGDEDLLERAEQREKDVAMEKLKKKHDEGFEVSPSWGSSRGALSDSSFNYEPFDSAASARRKRLLKKSQTVDRRTDDMAFRKMNKKRSSTISDPQSSALFNISYLQASPLYGEKDASFSDEADSSNKGKSKEPDITLDDVVYRNVKYLNSVPKVVESQPPFGIPLGPIPLSSSTDYLHVIPDTEPQSVAYTKRSKIPDLVKDDLAFRNLRKDNNKEPVLFDDFRGNTNNLNVLKKNRAVRSLSANISNLINGDMQRQSKKREHRFKTLTDIANDMELSRRDIKQKGDNIAETRRGFLSDTDASSHLCLKNSTAKSRMNFLNSLRVPSQNSDSQNSASSALHAKPPRGLTPERATTPEKRSPKPARESTPIYISPLEEKQLMRKSESLDSSFDDLLKTLAAEARKTSERITKELDELRKEAIPQEQEDDAEADHKPVIVEVQKTMTPEPSTPVKAVIISDTACESDHDYENLKSDQELDLDVRDEGIVLRTTPFEEHKAEIVASFQELKKVDIKEEATPPLAEKEPSLDTEEHKSIEAASDETIAEEAKGEACAAALDASTAYPRECGHVKLQPSFNHHNQTVCSYEESVISNCSSNNINEPHIPHCNSDTLKSPKLVLETLSLSEQRPTKSNALRPSQFFRPDSKNSSRSNEFRNCSSVVTGKAVHVWYRDPATVAIACSYGIACAHQIASLDFVTFLGILFAIVSFIAAFFY